MTTLHESIQLIEYLRDHGFIGNDCWADSAETERDHAGYDCMVEIDEYRDWESAMRPPTDSEEGRLVHNTYYELRRLAIEHWEQKHGSSPRNWLAVLSGCSRRHGGENNP